MKPYKPKTQSILESKGWTVKRRKDIHKKETNWVAIAEHIEIYAKTLPQLKQRVGTTNPY